MEASHPPVTFGRVEARADRVLIVASGPSVRKVPLDRIAQAASAGVHVIAVNGMLRYLPTAARTWFTLDPDSRILPLMANPRPGVTYYAAVPDDYGTMSARVYYHRVAVPAGVVYLHRISGDGVLGSMPGLSEDPAAIHTGNSAWGALGLAYLMGARRIALLGVDGTAKRYAYGFGRPRGSFAHLPGLFETALPQLQERGVAVRNGSPASRVTCFARTPAIEAVRWIERAA